MEEGGLLVRCAQSRGEWPGSSWTFLEGRAEGARVEVEGARREDVAGFRPGGARRVEAVDGGGRRDATFGGFGGF